MMVTNNALWLFYREMASFTRVTRSCRVIRTRVTNIKFHRRSFQSIYHGTAMSGKDMVQWGAAADEYVAQAF
jgi:hypothetical protein